MSILMRKQTTAGHLPNFATCSQDSNSTSPDLEKQFKVIKTLSISKFSVYKVYSIPHRRFLALKHFTSDSAESQDFFFNETRFISIQHPHIISYLPKNRQLGLQSNKPFILMELALCDFVDLFEHISFSDDERLARTYFCQLIEGLEYLHSKGIAHLDIKLENLLLGEDFNLKITDFDTSVREGEDLKRSSSGSLNARAPEIVTRQVRDPMACDIYSAGLILFALKYETFAYSENEFVDGVNLFKVLLENPQNFFEIFENVNRCTLERDNAFMKLFLGMVHREPEKRMTINEIKMSEWYNGPVYSRKEVTSKMNNIFRKTE